MDEKRLDRQMRIKGWDQSALSKASIGIVGNDPALTSLYSLSASALGINNQVVIAPSLDDRLVKAANNINPDLDLSHIRGFFVHPAQEEFIGSCSLIVDITNYNISNMLLLNHGFEKGIPVVRGMSGKNGFKIFSYIKGREWKDLNEIISENSLPNRHYGDDVLSIIASGILLEETKNILMGRKASDRIIRYEGAGAKTKRDPGRILVVGAGALGNFVGLGLAYSGCKHIAFMDPDNTESTNLNRQVFLYGSVGKSKAVTLSNRMNDLFGTKAKVFV